jgi:hypothetical protein
MVASHPKPGGQPALALGFAYVAVGLLGFGLAVGAVAMFRPGCPLPVGLQQTGARAQRLLLGGLSLNTILCALLLIATRVISGARNLQNSFEFSNAMGLYLLIGGDVLSVVYLVLVVVLKTHATAG